MLTHARELVSKRERRHDRRRLYAPRIHWASWLQTGGEEEEALPNSGRKANRQGTSGEHPEDDADTDLLIPQSSIERSRTGDRDLENYVPVTRKPTEISQPPKARSKEEALGDRQPFSLKLRGHLADSIEWIQASEDLVYAFKLSVATFLVTWPAFVASWNTWFSVYRGRKWPSLLIHVQMFRGNGSRSTTRRVELYGVL